MWSSCKTWLRYDSKPNANKHTQNMQQSNTNAKSHRPAFSKKKNLTARVCLLWFTYRTLPMLHSACAMLHLFGVALILWSRMTSMRRDTRRDVYRRWSCGWCAAIASRQCEQSTTSPLSTNTNTNCNTNCNSEQLEMLKKEWLSNGSCRFYIFYFQHE